jgi:hypothetical protein
MDILIAEACEWLELAGFRDEVRTNGAPDRSG